MNKEDTKSVTIEIQGVWLIFPVMLSFLWLMVGDILVSTDNQWFGYITTVANVFNFVYLTLIIFTALILTSIFVIFYKCRAKLKEDVKDKINSNPISQEHYSYMLLFLCTLAAFSGCYWTAGGLFYIVIVANLLVNFLRGVHK